jgi:hypothetical protein
MAGGIDGIALRLSRLAAFDSALSTDPDVDVPTVQSRCTPIR